jgi:anti-anti-sigma regulatory factor
MSDAGTQALNAGQIHALDASATIVSKVIGILLGSDETEMYGDVLTLLLETFESRFGFFGYIDEENSLVCPSMTRDIFEACQVQNKSTVFPRSLWGGLWGRVLIEKKALSKNVEHVVPKGHLPLHRSMGAPILYRGELIGSIHLANRTKDYEDTDVALLEKITSIIAPVLAARLERDRQDEKRRAAEASLERYAKDLASTNEELDRVNKELAAQVLQQGQALRELSTPIIQVWRGVLVAPLIGALDAERMSQFTARLLETVASSRAAVVLIDITGLPTVDTSAAQHLFRAVDAVRLLGAEAVLTGVRPAIAQTMVHLGIETSHMETRSSLASGLDFAFRALRLRVVAAT